MTGQIIRLDGSDRSSRQLDQIAEIEKLARRYKRRFGFPAFADAHGQTAGLSLDDETAFWKDKLGDPA